MKLIKIKEDYYVVVDDSEIKEGDWYLIGRTIYHCLKNIPKDLHNENKIFKITHSTQPLEEKQQAPTYTDNAVFINFNSQKVYDKVKQLSIQEVKELIGEVDVEKMAEEYFNAYDNTEHTEGLITGFEHGYNQCIKDNKEKKYTEEDIRKAYDEGYSVRDAYGDSFDNMTSDEYVKSLQPKTEWEVEIVDDKLKLK